MKIIKGDALLPNMVLELEPYASRFYGPNFKSEVKSAVKSSILYEWNDESFPEIVYDITGTHLSDSESASFGIEDTTQGFHLTYLSDSVKGIVDTAIVVRNRGYGNLTRSTLCHELFGHGVCAVNNKIFQEGPNIYIRNGIELTGLNNSQVINKIANEGMIDFITRCIMYIYDKDFIFAEDYYEKACEVAAILFQAYGKDKMLDLLVNGEGNINELFDPNTKSRWDVLSILLDRNNVREDVVVDREMREFIKRKTNN